MCLIQSPSYLNEASCIELHSKDGIDSSETDMQTPTVKSSEITPRARVVRIWRARKRNRPYQRRLPSAATYRPPSGWTVIAAFILAVALHAGAIVWVELTQGKVAVEAGAPVLIPPAQELLGTSAGTSPEEDAPAKSEVD